MANTMLNLHAPIVPGKSAAGFTIGMDLDNLSDLLRAAKTVDYYVGFNLNQAIDENTGILCIRGFGNDGVTTLYFGPDTVRLDFARNGKLGCIYVFDGYKGKYKEASIGTPLALIAESEPLIYDQSDEMYYRDDGTGDYLGGLAVVALEANHDEFSEVQIEGFCIHDWDLFKASNSSFDTDATRRST